ncbi:unnamed protein product [Candidula unifasciata]|uniref:Uncharacterized protein n=1 Tax=Candidula unifasciata TaxID=100452 RepID=A0A8S3ZNN2_9EUPU|nr:unnamed protein product [Candidula unifasciata]
MTAIGVMISKTTLSGSPSSMTNFCYNDTSGTGSDFRNAVQQIEERRLLRYTQFPSLTGIYDCPRDHSENKIKTVRWEKEVTSTVKAPHRAYDNLIDPISGFVNNYAVDDVDGNIGNIPVESMVQLIKTPQYIIPRAETLQQKKLVSPCDLTGLNTWSPGAPTAWNSRKTQDMWIRSKLGGWTSDVDPRKANDLGTKPQSSLEKEESQNVQDQLALKYIYSSSTQRGYEDVPWDSILQPKQWPSTLSVYDKPDLVLYQRNAKTCSPEKQHCQMSNASTSGISSRYPNCQDGLKNCASLEYQLQQSPLYRSYALEKPSCDHRRKSRMSKMVTLVPPYNPFSVVEKVPLHS